MLDNEIPKPPLILKQIDVKKIIEELKQRVVKDPSLLTSLKSLVEELELVTEKDLASRWEMIIRNEGSAILHAKTHPAWFKENESVNKPEIRPGFADTGHINASPKSINHARPPISGLCSNVFKYGGLPTSGIKIEKDRDQLLFLSPSTVDANEYNILMLDRRFGEQWRELDCAVSIKEHEHVPIRNPSSVWILRIFLPEERAIELFNVIRENPSLGESLLRQIYPGLPSNLELEGKERLLAKEMSVNDLGEKYSNSALGGEFIQLN